MLLAIAGFALFGMASCIFFSILSEMMPVGQMGQLDLLADFFRTPLTALAFLGMLVFLSVPVLGLRRDFLNSFDFIDIHPNPIDKVLKFRDNQIEIRKRIAKFP